MSANAKNRIIAHFKNAKKKIEAAEKKAHSYIKKHPEKAVGIAAAVGAAVGAAVATGVALAKKKR